MRSTQLQRHMKIAVWDTYVLRRTEPGVTPGARMHFDILVPDGTPFEDVQAFGRTYLTEKGQSGQPLTTQECRFCHVEHAPLELAAAIAERGFSIIEMEGCKG